MPGGDDLERLLAARSATTSAPEKSQKHPQAKPYSRPALRHLGSVRTLTLGGTGPRPDFSGGRHKH